MQNLIHFFKRGQESGEGKDPPAQKPTATGQTWTEGPCLRCGEWATRNYLQFCYGCWVFATDLARWATDKKTELGLTDYEDGQVVEIPVEQWAFVFTAKFPRDPGPDPQDATYPATIVPKGSYWQPEGGRIDPTHGKVRGICSCHFHRWN